MLAILQQLFDLQHLADAELADVENFHAAAHFFDKFHKIFAVFAKDQHVDFYPRRACRKGARDLGVAEVRSD